MNVIYKNAQQLMIFYCRACHKILVLTGIFHNMLKNEECVKTTDIMLSRMSQDMARGDGDPTEGKMSFPCFLPSGCFFFSPKTINTRNVYAFIFNIPKKCDLQEYYAPPAPL